MIQIPLNDGGVFAIIEPGNVKRLKDGRPLIVGNCMIAFTPDMQAFLALLGIAEDLPAKGEPPIAKAVHLTPEEIQRALDAVQKHDEVLR